MEPRTRPDEAWAAWESPYAAADAAEEPAPGAGGPPPPPRWDLRPLLMLLDAVRRGLPGDLQEQFTALVRELLLTMRAMIDWYLERLDHGPPEPEVEDIPID